MTMIVIISQRYNLKEKQLKIKKVLQLTFIECKQEWVLTQINF